MADLLVFIERMTDVIWIVPCLLIISLGVVSTIVFRGVQLRKFVEMVKVTFSNKGKKGKADSAFRVFCISMASRIGVGNISGPIVAILVGGPGAIFWIWIFAIIGSATAYVEAILGQLFKRRGRDGTFEGGPAMYISRGLRLGKVAIAMAFLLAMLNITAFSSIQASAAVSSMANAFSFEGNTVVFAILLTVIVLSIVIGGFKRISDISALVIPFAAVAWIVLCIAAIIVNGNVVGALQSIFSSAFSVPAFVGGGLGAVMIVAMKRSIFSNEAGLGKTVCVSSAADVKHPVFQGYTQALGVIIDMTILTATALVVLSFTGFDPLQKSDIQSMELLHQAFGPLLGDAASFIITVFVLLFAVSTIYGDYFIGQVNIRYLTEKKVWIYISYAVLAIFVFLPALHPDDNVFIYGDLLMALVASINCICIFFLFKRAVALDRDFERQKREGIKEPEFHKSALEGDTEDITEWD